MSILINLLAILVVYFYLPPDAAGLPQLVTDRAVLGILNAIVLIAAAGRLLDAVTDPLVAVLSDRSTHAQGRRIPFMRWGSLPSALLTVLMFTPPVAHVSTWNIVWLLCIQALLFVALTAYVTPAFALVADLGRTPKERLDLTTWTTVAWSVGIIFAALTPTVADIAIDVGGLDPIRGWQLGVIVVASIAGILMVIPTFVIDEPRWSRSVPSAAPMKESFQTVWNNEFFRYYVAADFAYFSGLMIIQTGLLYFLTVLLELDERLSAPLLGVMVIVAVVLYPVVNKIAKNYSGKRLVVAAFALSAVCFIGIVFLGRYPIPPLAQGLILIILFAMPFSVLSVVPGWILSDVAEHSSLATGDAKVGMFFAARTFLQKIASTLGVVLFAVLASFGRDVGDDLGIRLAGIAGFVLYLTAAVMFARYDEDKLRRELGELSDGAQA